MESSSRNLVAALRKRKQQSAVCTEIENVTMDFPFLLYFNQVCISLLHVYLWSISFMQKDWHFMYKTSFAPQHLIIMGILLKKKKKKELKLAAITNPTPVYLEPL